MKSHCFPKMKAVWAFGQSLNFKRLVFRGGLEEQSNKSWVFIPELAHHPDCSFRAPKAKSQPQDLNRPWCRQTPRPTPLHPPSTQRLGPIVLVEGLGFRFLGLGLWGLKVSGLLALWGFGVRIWGLSLITKAPRVRASFSTSRSEPGINGGGGCQFWTVFAAALRGTDDFQALAFGLFSGKIPGVHSGSVLVGFRRHFRRFMRAFGGGFGHFRRLMRAFGLPELPGPGSCYQSKAIEKGLQHN